MKTRFSKGDRDAIEAWPEAESFIKDRLGVKPDNISGVPAVIFKDLSTKFGLPPQVVAA